MRPYDDSADCIKRVAVPGNQKTLTAPARKSESPAYILQSSLPVDDLVSVPALRKPRKYKQRPDLRPSVAVVDRRCLIS